MLYTHFLESNFIHHLDFLPILICWETLGPSIVNKSSDAF